MLVSLAIVGTIMTMVYGSYAATSRSLDVYSSRMACSERAQLVLRLMARQIRCAYMPPVAAAPARTDAARNGTPATPMTAFHAEPPGLRADVLSLITTGGLGTGLDGPAAISRVAYRYDRPSAILSICCEPCVYGPDSTRGSGTWRPVLSGITNIELGFYDGRQWQPRWNSKQAGRLPLAVRIALTVREERGREHRYTTTVPVICQTRAQGQP